MLTNIHKSHMGTVSFDAKFPGMRKAQDFIVYPIRGDQAGDPLLVQSDTRIGHICPLTGRIDMAGPFPSGAYNPHLMFAKHIGTLSAEDLLMLNANVFATAHGAAGKTENGIVQCDNSGALAVFG